MLRALLPDCTGERHIATAFGLAGFYLKKSRYYRRDILPGLDKSPLLTFGKHVGAETFWALGREVLPPCLDLVGAYRCTECEEPGSYLQMFCRSIFLGDAVQACSIVIWR